MSEYDWAGSYASFTVADGSEISVLLAGPEDPALTGATQAYDVDLESTGEAEWLIRHIGEMLPIAPNAEAPLVQRYAWLVRYVPDLRVFNLEAPIRSTGALGADQIIAHGLGLLSTDADGIVRTLHTAGSADADGGPAWDVESVKPADDHAGVMLQIANPGSTPMGFELYGRTLMRG